METNVALTPAAATWPRLVNAPDLHLRMRSADGLCAVAARRRIGEAYESLARSMARLGWACCIGLRSAAGVRSNYPRGRYDRRTGPRLLWRSRPHERSGRSRDAAAPRARRAQGLRRNSGAPAARHRTRLSHLSRPG